VRLGGADLCANRPWKHSCEVVRVVRGQEDGENS